MKHLLAVGAGDEQVVLRGLQHVRQHELRRLRRLVRVDLAVQVEASQTERATGREREAERQTTERDPTQDPVIDKIWRRVSVCQALIMYPR